MNVQTRSWTAADFRQRRPNGLYKVIAPFNYKGPTSNAKMYKLSQARPSRSATPPETKGQTVAAPVRSRTKTIPASLSAKPPTVMDRITIQHRYLISRPGKPGS